MGIKSKLIYLIIGIILVLGFSSAAMADTVTVPAVENLVVPELTPMTKPAASVTGKPSGDTSAVVTFSDSNLASALAEKAGCSVSELTINTLLGFSGTLDLSNKNISELQGIENLSNVEYLILNKNPIYSRPELSRLAELDNLKGLEIAALSFSVVPSAICSMENLEYLNIDANRLETLPSSFSSLELEGLSCNYCFFDINPGSATLDKIKAATKTANYQYQLTRLQNFYITCQEMGVGVMHWDAMPDLAFANGAKAVVKRYSICEPRIGESRGSWVDAVSSAESSYSFSGLDGTASYSFDASVDYYITNTSYDGKYIKNYQKSLFIPKPQPTPTPMPTATPTATIEPTPTAEANPAVSDNNGEQNPETTSTPITNITPTPAPASNNTSSDTGSNFLRNLTYLVLILIVLIIALLIVLVLRISKQNR